MTVRLTALRAVALALLDAIEPFIPALIETLLVCVVLVLFGAPGYFWFLGGLLYFQLRVRRRERTA